VSRAQAGSASATRYEPQGKSFPLVKVNLKDATDAELAQISKEMSIGLSVDEMKRVRDHFSKQGRQPTDVELEALGQSWSEHCCYKSSKPVLKKNIYGIAEHKIHAREDAGVVEFDKDHFYCAKIESHNHPSAIEPYGGAATGIGGVVRDVTCMGAQPIALLDPLFFGPIDMDPAKVPKGTKHPRYIFQGVVEGIRDYGNRIGIPTVAGSITFHRGYVTNPLVNVGCIGIMPKANYTPSRAKAEGDVYIYAGGATGRDGIHGVTFASQELTEGSEESSRSAVQLGDPITKEPLIHACLEIVEKRLVQGMKDFGGGGLSCVCSEMAHDAGLGAEVQLDKVPLKEAGLAPWEIWVSESQERMMVAVKPENVDEVLHIFRKWDVTAVVVGRVIKEPVVRVLYHGEKVLEMDLTFQTGGPVYDRPVAPAPVAAETPLNFAQPADLTNVVTGLLGSLNLCSREWVLRQYDHEVRAATTIKPLQGRIGYVGPADATVLKPLVDSWRGLALTTDVNPRLLERHPYWGAASAMDETIRNLAAVGARLSSICDNLNFGNPEDPEVMGQLNEATRGMADVARALDIPFSSGNVSLYNEGPEGPVPPTPTLLGVGIVSDIRKCTTTDFKAEGNLLYLVGRPTARELGGSAYIDHVKAGDGETVPRMEPKQTARIAEAVVQAAEAGLSRSCHDVSEGGVGVAVCEMAFGANLGATIDVGAFAGQLRADHAIFSETNSRYIVEVAAKDAKAFEAHFAKNQVAAVKVGSVGGAKIIFKHGASTLIDLPVAKARAAWEATLHQFMAG
jgi:phosphoribosylformylglycinamidine synthase subunit PurL